MNYNPKTDRTLLSAVASDEQAQQLETIKNKVVSNNDVKALDIELGSNLHSYILRLITNYENLATFWKLNFPEYQKNNKPDGKIYFLDTDIVNVNFNFDKYRYYILEEDEVISLNNDFYGNLKITYRGLGANIAIKQNLVSLHSAAIKLHDKTIVITGVSGAGKSTVLKYLLQKLHGCLIWEDWGFINPESLEIIIPNEIHNHLKINSLKSLLPDFNEFSRSHTEFYEQGNAYFESARIMINLRNYIPFVSNIDDGLKVDTLVMLTNDKTRHHFIERIDDKEAKELFFSPINSKAYDNKVHYFNGALFLNDSIKERHRFLYSKFLSNLKTIIQINNNYTDIDYQRFLTYL